MDQPQKDALKKAFDGVHQTKQDFLLFKSQTHVQLLDTQLGLFQSLATIILAFLAIIFATEITTINLWFYLSTFSSISLLLYTTSYTREIIDTENKSLIKAEENINKTILEVEEIMRKTFKDNDYKIFENYVKSRREKKEETQKIFYYPGEIAMFFFYTGLFFGIMVMASNIPLILYIGKVYLFTFIICFSLLLSIKDWGIYLTMSVSKFFNKNLTFHTFR